MASLLNRWRSRSHQVDTAPQSVVTTTTETNNPVNMAGEREAKPAMTDAEKQPHAVNDSGDAPGTDAEDEDEADLAEDLRELPKIVRSIVSLEDDPNAPTITFRYFLLCFIFVPPGAILFQMGIFRTTASAYPILFVQIGMLPLRIRIT